MCVLLEDGLLLPTYDGVLSLLWIAELDRALGTQPDEDDQLLPELDPSEFTLERRRWRRHSVVQ